MAACLSRPASTDRRELVRRTQRARRRDASRVLQPAGRHARHHHGVPRGRAAVGRRVRQLPDPAPDWRTRHGVPAAQHGELLDVPGRRRRDARQLLRARRRSQLRMDVVSSARRFRDHGTDALVGRHVPADRLGHVWVGQHHHDHRAAARARADVVPPALLRVGTTRDRVSAAAGVSSIAGRRDPAVRGSGARHELLPSIRPVRRRCGGETCWRRQPAVVAAPVLVSGAPRGLRADTARDGDCGGDHRQQHAQAALGLSRDGLRHHLPRVHVVCRVGAPHVPDGHGHHHQRVLSDDDDDHLGAIGDRADRIAALALRRIHPVQYANVVRAGVSADVRDRRAVRPSVGPGLERHPAPRHDVCRRTLSLRRRPRKHLRPLRRHLLLVPEDHGTNDERGARLDSFRRLVHVHERDPVSDVDPRPGGRQPPAV